MLDATKTKHVLEFSNGLRGAVLQNIVDVVDDGLNVGAAVLR
jgi:hypothetical protein